MNASEPRSEPQPGAAPEGQWLWRRLYVFALSAAVWATLCAVLARAPAADSLAIAHALMRLLALVVVVYLVAPSTQQIVGVVSAALALRAGAGR